MTEGAGWTDEYSPIDSGLTGITLRAQVRLSCNTKEDIRDGY